LRARVQASLERQRLQREQSQTLSQLRQEREALAVQRERADNLLANILPPSVIKRLGNAEQQVADAHASVSVLFADLVNFTAWANTQTAQTTVRALNQIYTAFDRATQAAGVEKIKTIGDAYMAVAGLAPPLPDHATRCAALGLQLQRLLHELVAQHQWPLNLRVGIHSGPVVAGVIGEHKFAYDVWGDTVNTASRIESAAQPGKVLVSASTALGCDDSLSLTPQTPLPLKGLGMVQTFEVQLKHPTQTPMG
jgi:class 3 adenylate cyclase